MSSASAGLGLSDNESESGDRSRASSPRDVAEGEPLSPPRPTRTEYADYAAIVRAIDQGDHVIAKRILSARDAEGTDDQTHIPRPAPAKGKGKAKRATPGESSTNWPLQPTDLEDRGAAQGEGGDWLEDSIMAFASAYIRQHRLVPPLRQDRVALPTGRETELETLEDVMPRFLPAIMDMVDSLLDILATMRPAATRSKRHLLKPLGWEQVIAAGMLTKAEPDALAAANATMREALNLEGEDRIAHRLGMLRDLHAAPPSRLPLRDLLPDVTGRHSKFRSHSSQQKQDEARRKRELKAAARLELEQARAAVKTEHELKPQHANKRRRTDDVPEPT